MQQINSKQSFTQECAFLALVRLMQDKPLPSISVTELAKKAGVSRTAFYNNYNCVEDVLIKHLDTCMDIIIQTLAVSGNQQIAIKQFVSCYFDMLAGNSQLLKNLESSGNFSIFASWLKGCFHGKLSKLIKALGFVNNYEVSACTGMFCELTRDWLTSGADKKSRDQAEGALYHLLYVYKQSADSAMTHYLNPQHIGKLYQYNAVGSFTLVDTGESIKVYLLIEHDHVVASSAEVTTIPGKEDILTAAANAVCVFVNGKPTTTAMSLAAEDVSRELCGLSKEFMYCAAIAASAAKNASIDYYNRLSLAQCMVGEEEPIVIKVMD